MGCLRAFFAVGLEDLDDPFLEGFFFGMAVRYLCPILVSSDKEQSGDRTLKEKRGKGEKVKRRKRRTLLPTHVSWWGGGCPSTDSRASEAKRPRARRVSSRPTNIVPWRSSLPQSSAQRACGVTFHPSSPSISHPNNARKPRAFGNVFRVNEMPEFRAKRDFDQGAKISVNHCLHATCSISRGHCNSYRRVCPVSRGRCMRYRGVCPVEQTPLHELQRPEPGYRAHCKTCRGV